MVRESPPEGEGDGMSNKKNQGPNPTVREISMDITKQEKARMKSRVEEAGESFGAWKRQDRAPRYGY